MRNPKMNDYQTFWEEKMKDPEFMAVCQEMQPEYDLAMSILAARMKHNLSQKELSALSGVRMKEIVRLENMDGNPDLKSLKQIAKGLDMRVNVEIAPKS